MPVCTGHDTSGRATVRAAGEIRSIRPAWSGPLVGPPHELVAA